MKFLLNEVKYGFMKSIAKWIDTPGDLQKNQTAEIGEDDKSSSKSSKKKTIKVSKPAEPDAKGAVKSLLSKNLNPYSLKELLPSSWSQTSLALSDMTMPISEI